MMQFGNNTQLEELPVRLITGGWLIGKYGVQF